ncbi:MAG: DNA-binding domain-containing protein [Pseudomonadota bacterium]
MRPQPNRTETAFSSALLRPQAGTPAQVTGPNGKHAAKRYNVYRNNVTVSLINALADIYPACKRIVGEDFFRALAREYVRAHPPTSPLLFRYGQSFADFIAGFGHTQHLPYLPDVARLERAWLTAYHAADILPLDPATLASVDPDNTGQLKFAAKPGTALIKSEFPVFTIYAMNRELMPLAQVDLAVGESALVTRPDADVIVTPVSAAEATFFDAILEQTKSLEASAAVALSIDEKFNLNDALGKLFATGATSSFALGSSIEENNISVETARSE